MYAAQAHTQLNSILPNNRTVHIIKLKTQLFGVHFVRGTTYSKPIAIVMTVFPLW